MKAIYDKILFVLALLALGAGVGFYFMKTSSVRSAGNLMNQQPSGPAYQAVQPPEVKIESVTWNDPEAQDAEGLELYDIFTPPQIFWNPIEGKLDFRPVEPPKPKQPFGLRLVSIEREMFRIQLEAYFQGPSGKPEDAIWQFYNSNLGESVRGHLGDSFPEHGFQLKSGSVKKVIKEDEGSTTVSSVPTVVIIDLQNDNREITLTTESKLFLEGKLQIKMATAEPFPPAEFVWEHTGQTYETGDTTFTLQQINFDNQTVTVEKTAPDLEKPEVKTLEPALRTPDIISSQPVSEPSPESEGSDIPPGLENFFN